MLLHHTAGNPFIRDLPENVVEVAGTLLDLGAEVDAVTLPGPSQPNDIGWTPLGLVATSGHARERGLQAPLMDALLEHGADPDARDGGCLMGALYYGEAAAAERLVAAGARVDLIAAAGIGDEATLAELLAQGAERIASAPRLVHYALTPWPEDCATEDEAANVLGLALAYAARHGRTGALRLLLDAGVDPNRAPPFDHGATALHWAAVGDQPEAVRVLRAAGADPEARDRRFGSTPAGWADYLGKARAAEALG